MEGTRLTWSQPACVSVLCWSVILICLSIDVMFQFCMPPPWFLFLPWGGEGELCNSLPGDSVGLVEKSSLRLMQLLSTDKITRVLVHWAWVKAWCLSGHSQPTNIYTILLYCARSELNALRFSWDLWGITKQTLCVSWNSSIGFQLPCLYFAKHF